MQHRGSVNWQARALLTDIWSTYCNGCTSTSTTHGSGQEDIQHAATTGAPRREQSADRDADVDRQSVTHGERGFIEGSDAQTKDRA